MTGESGETCFIRSPNPSNAGAVCNLGEGRLGAALEDHRSPLPSDVAGRRASSSWSRPLARLVEAIEPRH
jgi:hypothetical protein